MGEHIWRPIKQIVATEGEDGTTVVALCEDSTLWARVGWDGGSDEWKRVAPIKAPAA